MEHHSIPRRIDSAFGSLGGMLLIARAYFSALARSSKPASRDPVSNSERDAATTSPRRYLDHLSTGGGGATVKLSEISANTFSRAEWRRGYLRVSFLFAVCRTLGSCLIYTHTRPHTRSPESPSTAGSDGETRRRLYSLSMRLEIIGLQKYAQDYILPPLKFFFLIQGRYSSIKSFQNRSSSFK